jgi:ABC-type uncharacterized transport system auxiliary subunit
MKWGNVQGMMKWVLVLLCICLASGCFSRNKAPYLVEQYTVDYPPPSAPGLSALDTSMRIARFSVAHSFNTRAMVYKEDPYRVSTYNYSRWRVNPGDMVSDYLLRDFRAAAIFGSIFSSHNTEKTRFALEGGIEEFAAVAVAGGRQAVLALTVTLLDEEEREITKKVLFQKKYRFTEPFTEGSPEGYARAMSASISRFSEVLVREVYEAVKHRQEHTK